ncbi:MAG: GNAT family N-acetyltransferase [Armatimonadota bacterium]
MPDIICPLLNLADHRPLLKRLEEEGICIRPARPWEQTALNQFIKEHFGQGWVDETSVAFSTKPVTALVALDGDQIIGFAAYEVTAPAFFGPTGVNEAYRGRGIGKALLLESLAGMRSLGYVYGFIGAPGPVDFYLKAMKSMLLPEDWTSIYDSNRAVTIF